MEHEDRERALRRRVERGQAEILSRMVAAEKRWEEGEAERVREWEALEGRMMTAEDKRQAFDDALFRKMTIVTNEHSLILQGMITDMREARREMRDEFAESRAEVRAGREALLRILDRLPPPEAS